MGEHDAEINDIPPFQISPQAQRQKGGRRVRGRKAGANHPMSPAAPLMNLNSPERMKSGTVGGGSSRAKSPSMPLKDLHTEERVIPFDDNESSNNKLEVVLEDSDEEREKNESKEESREHRDKRESSKSETMILIEDVVEHENLENSASDHSTNSKDSERIPYITSNEELQPKKTGRGEYTDNESYRTPEKKPISNDRKENKDKKGQVPPRKKRTPSVNSQNKGNRSVKNKRRFHLSERRIPDFSDLDETEISQMWTNLEHDFNKIRRLNPDSEISMPDPDTESLEQATARKNQFLFEMRKDEFIEGKVDEYQMGLLIMWIVTEIVLIYFFHINANGYTDLQMMCSSQYDRILLEMGEEKWKKQGRRVKSDPGYTLVTSSLKIAGLYAGLRFLTARLPPDFAEKACQFAVKKLTKSKKEGGGFGGALSGIKDFVDTFQDLKTQMTDGGDMMGLVGNMMSKFMEGNQ